MFPLTRWSPARDLVSMQKEMEDIFGRFFGKPERFVPAWRALEAGYPAMDVARKGDNIVVHVALPGVDLKDVDLTVTGNLLTIKGERKEEKKVEEEDYFLREIGIGSFERSFTLPVEVKPEDVKASYKDGVLEIILPAETGAMKGRKIEITTEEKAKELKAA